MKTPFKTLVILLLFITLSSCNNEEETIPSLNLDNFSFENLKINLGKGVAYSYSSKKKQSVLSKLNDINNSLNEAFDKDNDLEVVSYQIIITDEGTVITNFDFTSASRNGEYTLWDAEAAWNCPKGTSQVGANCFSQSCVEANIETAFQGFSSGDTVVITVHHGGAFGGVKVCV